MNKCAVCGSVAEFEITPYTGATAGTMTNYCHDHAINTMITDNTKTYKVVMKEHVYKPFKNQLNDFGGGYVK